MQSQPITAEQLATMWVTIQPHAAAFISSLVRDFNDANDVLQEVATIVVRKREEYDPQKPFEGWVISIARLEVLKYRRTIARDRLQFSVGVLDELSVLYKQADVYEDDHREAMASCFEKVAGKPREAFRLRYVEEVNATDVGHRLGMSANAVTVMMHRTRIALRDCIRRRLGRSGASV